jgi:hypothetical protein
MNTEYSKQWCEENNSSMVGDFDILEVFGKLKLNTYDNWVCDGYKFGAIANIDGECMLLMPNGKWVSYDDVVR